jgi:hypothetical protein
MNPVEWSWREDHKDVDAANIILDSLPIARIPFLCGFFDRRVKVQLALAF